jgi:hypothetical protein
MSNNVRPYLALRLLLGLCEAGLYPGIAFYITWLVNASNFPLTDSDPDIVAVGTSARKWGQKLRYFFRQQRSQEPSVNRFLSSTIWMI